MITGLSGGLAQTFGIDSTWIRLLLVITAFFSGGVIIPLYFLAVIVIPKEPIAGGPFGPGYGFGGGPGQGSWNGGAAGWGQHKRHCGSHKYQYGDRREYEAQYNQYEGTHGQAQADQEFEEKMKDIEKKAMWKEIEELRAKVASYEKNQQTKGEV
jgi:phage shock protein PspC (stress-responsive transcriptional regulator)